MDLRSPAGIDDILPDETPLWRRIEQTAREVFARYGYAEIRLPIFEDVRVFTHNVGESTDLVEKGMFTFTSGDDTYCLRPEGTAAVVRAYLQHKLYKNRPFQKWFYAGPMFRHERAQRGRKWQFHQLGIEALGASDPLLDAEIIGAAGHFFDEIGLSGYRTQLNTLGCTACRDEYRAVLKTELEGPKDRLCEDCRRRMDRNVFRVLDCKQANCREVAAGLTTIHEVLCGDCKEHFDQTQAALDGLGVPYELVPKLVRGLDYYTGTVFEFVHSGLGAQDALGAGGRYDNLIEDNGGPSLGGAGFALGVERILLALQAVGLDEGPGRPDLEVYLVSIGPETRVPLFRIAGQLRRAGLRADLDHEGRGVKAQMRTANRSGAPAVLVLGGNELAENQITLKRMGTGDETRVPIDSVVEAVKDALANPADAGRAEEGSTT